MRIGLVLAWGLLASTLAADSGWKRFRGPNGAGVSEDGRLPVSFGPDTNVVWEAPMPRGKSSPVLSDGRVFLTAHEGGQLLTIALDQSTGRELWRRAAPSRRLERMHRLNDEAAPTPVTDGSNVYAFFGGYGLVSYDRDGVERWTLPLGPFTNYHGMGASPILVDGKLIMVCDQDLESYLLAVDPSDGEILWKRQRPDFVHSFSTPVVHRTEDNGPVIVVPGSYRMTGYSPAGVELWRLDGLTYQVKSGPVVDGDRLFFSGWAVGSEPVSRLELPAWDEVRERFDSNGDDELGRSELREDWHPRNWEMHDRNKNGTMDARDWSHYRARRISENSCIAVRLGGSGDVTRSNLLWRYQKSLPEVASPVLYRGVLYLVRNGGIVTALDPGTGSVLKQGRLRDALDGFYASPVAGDGKVYMTSDAGRVAVVAAGSDWRVLRTNDLEEDVYATPAIAGGRLFIRTATRLYCFGETGS